MERVLSAITLDMLDKPTYICLTVAYPLAVTAFMWRCVQAMQTPVFPFLFCTALEAELKKSMDGIIHSMKSGDEIG